MKVIIPTASLFEQIAGRQKRADGHVQIARVIGGAKFQTVAAVLFGDTHIVETIDAELGDTRRVKLAQTLVRIGVRIQQKSHIRGAIEDAGNKALGFERKFFLIEERLFVLTEGEAERKAVAAFVFDGLGHKGSEQTVPGSGGFDDGTKDHIIINKNIN